MLELSAISAHYAKNQVLRSVDLSVGAGEVVALIGANAAGKSTTMRLIAGLKRATSGSIRLDGIEIESMSTPRRVGLGIALVPEGRQQHTAGPSAMPNRPPAELGRQQAIAQPVQPPQPAGLHIPNRAARRGPRRVSRRDGV